MSATVKPRLAMGLAGALATVLACIPWPALARGRAAPLTATPGSLAFAIPLEPVTITATVQYTGPISASSDGDCASVAPASVPATKPEGSSVYLATFTVTPAHAGLCTISLTDKKGRQVQVPVDVRLEPSHVYFVAHQDDDLLFMNPDIQHAISAGHHVTTVYVTSGTCGADDFQLIREAGVMEAYSRLAGVANDWALTDQPIREIRLAAQRNVTLVLLRLPAALSEAGGVCEGAATNLQGLWLGGATPPLALSAVDGTNSYTREQLIAALANVIRRFHPVRIGTLDNTGLFGLGTDPSGVSIYFPNWDGGNCYYYDHSDHFYSAVFAAAARDSFDEPHEYLRYRGYNQANEDPNIAGDDHALKEAAFAAYGEHDTSVGTPPGFAYLYDDWVARQYEVSTAPGHAEPACP